MRHSIRTLALLLALLPLPVAAEDFSATNMQLLYGSGFHDPYFGNNTRDGRMSTVTIEHFGTWSHGDNYFFADVTSGDFVDFAGNAKPGKTRIYGEWSPRLSLAPLLGGALPLYLAGQFARDGEGYRADMIGLGSDLALPGFAVANVALYSRKDNFNRRTWQTTFVWSLPLGRFSCEGFADLYGSDANGIELSTQPQLLLDLGSLLGGQRPGAVQAGVEWHLHRHNKLNNQSLQSLLKWQW